MNRNQKVQTKSQQEDRSMVLEYAWQKYAFVCTMNVYTFAPIVFSTTYITWCLIIPRGAIKSFYTHFNMGVTMGTNLAVITCLAPG